jgi:hypothetical protein
VRACRQIFHGEIGKRTTSPQLIAGDSDSQHGKDSAPIGKAAKTNKDSHWRNGASHEGFRHFRGCRNARVKIGTGIGTGLVSTEQD